VSGDRDGGRRFGERGRDDDRRRPYDRDARGRGGPGGRRDGDGRPARTSADAARAGEVRENRWSDTWSDRRKRESGAQENRLERSGFVPAPPLPDTIAASSLDPAARRDLGGLQKDVAEAVARHLVAAGILVDEDPAAALAHARYARRRASRIAVVREAAGITAYHAGEWAEALAELRAARRMGGGPGHLAVMADIERAMGRPERAIELSRSPEARELSRSAQIELAIVVAGARRDLEELDAAVVALQVPELEASRRDPWSARLFYAYADNLLAAGRESDALQWFVHAAEADTDGQTDADVRIAELTGEPLADEGIEFGFDELDPGGESTGAADAEEEADAAAEEAADIAAESAADEAPDSVAGNAPRLPADPAADTADDQVDEAAHGVNDPAAEEAADIAAEIAPDGASEVAEDAPTGGGASEAADHAADAAGVNGTPAAGAPEEEDTAAKARDEDPTGSDATAAEPAEHPADSTSEHLPAPSGAEPR